MRLHQSLSSLLFSLLLLLGLTGCQTSNVVTDYDTAADFSQIHFYRWQEQRSGADKDIDPLINERTIQAIKAELIKESIKRATEHNKADIVIRHYLSSQTRSQEPNSRGSIGFGSAGGNSALGVALSFPFGSDTIIKEVQIIIDLLSTEDEQLKWRGSKNLTFSDESPEQITAKINAAVAEIFSFYPPGSKSK